MRPATLDDPRSRTGGSMRVLFKLLCINTVPVAVDALEFCNTVTFLCVHII